MNKIFLRGNLTKDVELRSTQKGNNIARFNLAIRRDFKNQEGKYDSDFVNCVAYGNQAEMINKYFHKGSGIIIVGHLQSGSYTKEDGTRVYTLDVIVENVEFDRVANEQKKETTIEKTDEEIIASVVNNDPYEAFGKQIELSDIENELPF
jgi:single-strand DNA-binding protein